MQSSTMEKIIRLVLLGLFRTSRIALAFISITTAVKFLSTHNIKPSLKAHSSAIKLEVIPICLENPKTQFPYSSRIIPPPPALPGFPSDDPSILSFLHPSTGFSHLTGFKTWQIASLAFKAQWIKSIALWRISD